MNELREPPRSSGIAVPVLGIPVSDRACPIPSSARRAARIPPGTPSATSSTRCTGPRHSTRTVMVGHSMGGVLTKMMAPAHRFDYSWNADRSADVPRDRFRATRRYLNEGLTRRC